MAQSDSWAPARSEHSSPRRAQDIPQRPRKPTEKALATADAAESLIAEVESSR